MLQRRLEDRIRELCARVALVPDQDFSEVLPELQTAMHEYTRRIENKTAAVLGWPEFPLDRRKA